MKIENRTITADKGKFVHKIGTDIYGVAMTLFPNEKLEDFEEVDSVPKFDTELEDKRALLLKEIDDYDKSADVNGFYINGQKMPWANKEDRAQIQRRLERNLEDGHLTCPINFGDMSFKIEPKVGLAMLKQLDYYADGCYDATFKHKQEVKAIKSAIDLEIYNIKKDYPTMPNFEIRNI